MCLWVLQDSDEFEDIGAQPAVQAMLRAEKEHDSSVKEGGVRARHHHSK